jgi:hypothetical protein
MFWRNLLSVSSTLKMEVIFSSETLTSNSNSAWFRELRELVNSAQCLHFWLDNWGTIPRNHFTTASRPTRRLSSRTWDHFSGSMRSGREAAYSSPSATEVKYGWSYTSSSLYVFVKRWLIKGSEYGSLQEGKSQASVPHRFWRENQNY